MGKKDKKKKERKRSRSQDDDTGEAAAAASPAPSGSLMDSIFGSSSAASTSASSALFSNSASLPPAKKTTVAAPAAAAAKESGNEDTTKKQKKKKSREDSLRDILAQRQEQSEHNLPIEFPEAFQQEDDEIELPREEQDVEMAQAVRDYGLCVIRDFTDAKEELQSLAPQAENFQKQVCQALEGNRQREWRTHKQTDTFQFKEAASRCHGRIDVAVAGNIVENNPKRYHFGEDGEYDDDVVSFHIGHRFRYPSFVPVLKNLLGDDLVLVYAGLIFNLPGSDDQPWHQDGVPLFQENTNSAQIQASLPPYALNVFIPLTDSDGAIEKGPTEFLPASHQWLSDKLERVNDEGSEKEVISPILRQGDALIYDYRVCHRGTSNLTECDKTSDEAMHKSTRRILYLMYARPWFTDHVNFDYTKGAYSIWNDFDEADPVPDFSH